MTLCIAAISRREQKIVTAMDFMLSTAFDSSDGNAAKAARVGSSGSWIVMFAGDPSAFVTVNTDAKRRLIGTQEVALDVVSAFESAYSDQLIKVRERRVLAGYGLGLKEFLDKGRDIFGTEEFLRILRKVEEITLETDFLIAGFDGPEPSIISVSHLGEAYFHDLSGFHTIGCGAPLADTMLTANYDPFSSLTDMIYRVAEAKFVGERAPGVGKKTGITVFDRSGWNGITLTNTERIKMLWKEKGKPKVPSESDGLISGSIEPFGW